MSLDYSALNEALDPADAVISRYSDLAFDPRATASVFAQVTLHTIFDL